MHPATQKAAQSLAEQIQTAKSDFKQPVKGLAGQYYRCQQHCYDQFLTLQEAEDCKMRCKAVLGRFNYILESQLGSVFQGFFKCAEPCSKGEDEASCLRGCQEQAGSSLQQAKAAILDAAEKAAKQYA